jgi:hypothetical protein
MIDRQGALFALLADWSAGWLVAQARAEPWFNPDTSNVNKKPESFTYL